MTKRRKHEAFVDTSPQAMYLCRARTGYINGGTTIEELEAAVEHALAGREVGLDGRVPPGRRWMHSVRERIG